MTSVFKQTWIKFWFRMRIWHQHHGFVKKLFRSFYVVWWFAIGTISLRWGVLAYSGASFGRLRPSKYALQICLWIRKRTREFRTLFFRFGWRKLKRVCFGMCTSLKFSQQIHAACQNNTRNLLCIWKTVIIFRPSIPVLFLLRHIVEDAFSGVVGQCNIGGGVPCPTHLLSFSSLQPYLIRLTFTSATAVLIRFRVFLLF